MNIRRVVFFVSRRTGAQAVAEACADLLSRAGISLCAPKKYSEPLTLPSAVELLDDEESVKSADLVLVIGGDGTILRANYYAAPYAIPILGINMGRLGFLSELEPGETALVEKVLCGQFRIDERMMLSVEVRREVSGVMKSLGMLHACSAVMWVLQQVLGLERDLMLCEPCAWRGRRLLHLALVGGNFGKYRQKPRNVFVRWFRDRKLALSW